MARQKIDLKELAKFLMRAKKNTYASMSSVEIKPERHLHKELEFSDGKFYYRDSYVGFFQAPGMEEVRLGKSGKTIWTMAYSGGMKQKYSGDIDFAKQVFNFLKEALSQVNENAPYRGPIKLKKGKWKYKNKIKGNIKRFSGKEKIFFNGKEVFSQEYIGGLVLDK